MISEKKYSKLIKNIPHYQAPADLTNNVVQKCGIIKDRPKGARFMFTDLIYGTACCGIIAVIITLGSMSYHAANQADIRLASNSVALAGQLAHGARVVFTGQR